MKKENKNTWKKYRYQGYKVILETESMKLFLT